MCNDRTYEYTIWRTTSERGSSYQAITRNYPRIGRHSEVLSDYLERRTTSDPSFKPRSGDKYFVIGPLPGSNGDFKTGILFEVQERISYSLNPL